MNMRFWSYAIGLILGRSYRYEWWRKHNFRYIWGSHQFQLDGFHEEALIFKEFTFTVADHFGLIPGDSMDISFNEDISIIRLIDLHDHISHVVCNGQELTFKGVVNHNSMMVKAPWYKDVVILATGDKLKISFLKKP